MIKKKLEQLYVETVTLNRSLNITPHESHETSISSFFLNNGWNATKTKSDHKKYHRMRVSWIEYLNWISNLTKIPSDILHEIVLQKESEKWWQALHQWRHKLFKNTMRSWIKKSEESLSEIFTCMKQNFMWSEKTRFLIFWKIIIRRAMISWCVELSKKYDTNVIDRREIVPFNNFPFVETVWNEIFDKLTCYKKWSDTVENYFWR